MPESSRVGRIELAYDAKSHLEKALQLNSSDPSLHHILGLWYFEFSDMNKFQKFISNFSVKMPAATYNQALSKFLEAEKIQENYLKKNTIMIGRSYYLLNDKVKAKEWLQKAAMMPNKTIEDEIDHEKAVEILKKLI